MLYRMRLENGGQDPSSSGTWIAPNGTPFHLRGTDFKMTPIAFWKSPANGAQYPVGWRVTVPGMRMEFTIQPALKDQELTLGPITYWEGAIDAVGTWEGKPSKGRGYLELTGYGGKLVEALQR
jgi:predicted secreted hydrolase